MLGQMQDWPLLIHRIIDHAATYHGGRPVISRSIEGPFHTTTYAEIRARAKKVAQPRPVPASGGVSIRPAGQPDSAPAAAQSAPSPFPPPPQPGQGGAPSPFPEPPRR